MKISIDRVMKKLDDYFAKNDYIGAERHLQFWYEEAKMEQDTSAQFFLANECIGYYRKQGKKDLAFSFVSTVLTLIEDMQIQDTIGAATAYLNTATAYKAFDLAEKGLPFFEKAQHIYEAQLQPDDPRLAGLYNNMGLALGDLGRFSEAKQKYQKALQIMKKQEDGALDAAITYLNLADITSNEIGFLEAEDQVNSLLQKAKALLDSHKTSLDGYYAFVCEKCASTFGYYGDFLYKKELTERAQNIYARH